jgi:hypothetical protein
VKTAETAIGSGGLGEIRRTPVPGQQLANPLGGMIGQPCKNVGEPSARIDVVEFRRLCRLPNYAERAGFPQHSS